MAVCVAGRPIIWQFCGVAVPPLVLLQVQMFDICLVAVTRLSQTQQNARRRTNTLSGGLQQITLVLRQHSWCHIACCCLQPIVPQGWSPHLPFPSNSRPWLTPTTSIKVAAREPVFVLGMRPILKQSALTLSPLGGGCHCVCCRC